MQDARHKNQRSNPAPGSWILAGNLINLLNLLWSSERVKRARQPVDGDVVRIEKGLYERLVTVFEIGTRCPTRALDVSLLLENSYQPT
jgi:hypothetical protein